MEIFGVGTEIVECLRIGRMIERHDEAFLRRVFTTREISFCSGSRLALHQYSVFWAAKQAVLKALNIRKTSEVAWNDLEIRSKKGSSLTVAFGGDLQQACVKRQIAVVHIAIASCRNYATATAIAVKREKLASE